MLNINIPNTLGGCISTNAMLYGFGALAGLVILSKLLRDSRPILVSATKEVIAFQQWLTGNLEEGKEFWEDVFSEARHLYRLEVEKKLEVLQKQQEILQRIKDRL
ncbi:conserved hypothetical protein [Hydrogenobacter thermophilus TK-6]|uniref:Uncharacterized protein n=1 Tax=Hydrogenobacter thermophilus (strain DSM 6534 / IAM 12695 / TK-6) TaxID=608538 RepID=D3DGA9_HYDTT|nr:hypothetical protein [Hydrogenobacter thermophilus]ADO44796.1 conserved hypothetical protein [Hydrogenobacter thermophilus TK-6]BAI68861.1 hypothetical protein HTH_0397 [Hydrogenobacter thermophilus TK-6]